MKKLLTTASAIAVLATFALPAHAECDGWYAGLRGGMVKHDLSGDSESAEFGGATIKFDDDLLMISGALGYRYQHWRGEFEFVWRDYVEGDDPLTTEKFKTYSYMLNVYYDLLPYNWWTPYVNAGIGLTQTKYSSFDKGIAGGSNLRNGNYDPMNFTWAVGAGLSLKVTNRFNVDAGYRYYDMGGIRAADLDAQEIYAGVRYVF